MKIIVAAIVGMVVYWIADLILPTDAGTLAAMALGVVAAVMTFLKYKSYKEKASDVVAETVSSARSAGDAIVSKIDQGDAHFFAIAEGEVDDGTYDRGLWSQAFVKAAGDESKRKVTYIKLRVAQLRRS